MNLSEIRKKAQKERSAEEPAATVPPPAPEAAENGGGQAAQSLPLPDAEEIGEKPHAVPSPVRAEPPPLKEFDPLSVLLAGRAAALGPSGGDKKEASSLEAPAEESREWLCFKVAGEKYAVDIMEIREIIKPREVTEVPRMPDFVTGIISLRGIIIPVFDMQRRLGHESAEKTGKERIIVVNRGEEFCGILADEVIQVASLNAASIEPPPAVLEGIDRDFVGGIGRVAGEMMIMLNLGKILDTNIC